MEAETEVVWGCGRGGDRVLREHERGQGAEEEKAGGKSRVGKEGGRDGAEFGLTFKALL
jgi:hypothetical protein